MKNSTLVKIWVAKNDSNYRLYSTEDELKQLTEDHYNSFFPDILRSVIDYSQEHEGREPGEDPEDENVFYYFFIALHYTEEINNMVLSPDFFQGRIGSGQNPDFAPIIHILQATDGLIFLKKDYAELYKDAPRYRFIIDSSIWNYLATDIEDFKEDVKSIVTNWDTGYYYLHIAREYVDLNARLTQASYLRGGYGSTKGKGHGAEVSPFLFHSETLLRKKLSTMNVPINKWRILLLDDKIDKEKEECYYILKDSKKILEKGNTGLLSSDFNEPLTKVDILEKRINQMELGGCKCILARKYERLPDFINDMNYNIQIVCVETVKEALKLMREYEFDIILIDYLLQYIDNNKERQADYGYKLLKRIKSEYEKTRIKKKLSKADIATKIQYLTDDILVVDDFDIDGITTDAFEEFEKLAKTKKIRAIDLRGTNIRDILVDRRIPPFNAIPDKIKIYLPARNYIEENTKEVYLEKNLLLGPQNKFFFMFISAFTTAVNERLTLEGMSRNEEIWEIGEGACPTNTPELFKYRLVHLMQRRLDQTGISELTENNILNTVKDIFSSQTESAEERIKSVRKRAYNNYHRILGYHYDYSILRENDRGRSALVDSFLEKQVHLGAMLEHLLQMIHLIAFGTVRQWPEIWEEYKFFTRTVSSERELIPPISSMIEKYIITLKSV